MQVLLLCQKDVDVTEGVKIRPDAPELASCQLVDRLADSEQGDLLLLVQKGCHEEDVHAGSEAPNAHPAQDRMRESFNKETPPTRSARLEPKWPRRAEGSEFLSCHASLNHCMTV